MRAEPPRKIPAVTRPFAWWAAHPWIVVWTLVLLWPGRAPLPVLVYYHGGGHVIGSIDTHDRTARYLCLYSGCMVVSVDYRLAPEHRFPAAVDDCYAVLKWLKDNAPEVSYVVAHGQMAAGELDDRMNAFYDGRYDVLLSTTIIESGLDIPRANTIFIDRADRDWQTPAPRPHEPPHPAWTAPDRRMRQACRPRPAEPPSRAARPPVLFRCSAGTMTL